MRPRALASESRSADAVTVDLDEAEIAAVDAHADDYAATAESYESAAAPLDLPRVERSGADSTGSASPPPDLNVAIAHVPEAARALLKELFKTEITAVRRVSRDQLR